MEEMIKEAEMLYKQIGDAQLTLVRSRLNNDEEGNRLAISEMETAMCNAFQFLKCLIDRKNNLKIINFRNLWKEQPDKGKETLVFVKGYKPIVYRRFDEKYFWGCQEVLWIYTDEIMPKGGD